VHATRPINVHEASEREQAYFAERRISITASRREDCRIARPYAELGDKERAFEWLNVAYQERNDGLISLKIEFALDPLRSDPRFAELVRKVGLPQ
jgi:hypothetical protein